MQRKWFTAALAGVLVVVSILRAATEQPATQPTDRSTTEPRGASVRGRILISSVLASQKPDLSRVVVFLGADPALDATPPREHPSVSQHNKAFSPNFLVISVGTEVEFPNWDHFDHNVFSRSKAAPAFDLDRYGYGLAKSRVFDKVGVVQVFCNVHPQMRSIIYVTPNRYFTRADGDGRFELRDVPAGDYELFAWQDRCGQQQQAVKVGADGVSDITFMLDESRNSILANNPPQQREGYGVARGLGVKREQLDLPVVHEVHPALTTAPTQ